MLSGIVQPTVLMILGPTASGKSELALAVARARDGEIISGDAFAVYRGLDIGTAKPDARIRAEVPHHLIDVAEPKEEFSAGRWAREARRLAKQIESRGHLPIVCGGSGFYVRSLLGGLPAGEVRWPELRAWLHKRLQNGASVELLRMLALLDPVYAAGLERRDRARLSRALEVIFATGRPTSARAPAPQRFAEERRLVKVALLLTRDDLYARIRRRVDAMLAAGWADEVALLLRRGVPADAHCFRAIGYRELASVYNGEWKLEEARESIVRATWQLARRQRVWLSRELDLRWLMRPDPAGETLAILDAGKAERPRV